MKKSFLVYLILNLFLVFVKNKIYSFGCNNDEQLGLGTINSNIPKIINFKDASKVFTGHGNSAIIDKNDQVYFFGSNLVFFF
jgi:alpha-tubulin suppressor-like RCC1 family protein